eukprot:scaffold34159_cov58-Phaeocystis_antarctica.AAC.5
MPRWHTARPACCSSARTRHAPPGRPCPGQLARDDRQLARRAHALDLHDELAQPRLRLSALLVDGALERHRRLPPGTALAAAVRALRQLATHATERELLARFPGQRDLRAASLAERAASLAPEERGEAR